MRLYLSYRRTDRAFVEQIRGALVAQGHEAWWDGSLAPGEAFDVQIENHLRASDVVVSFLSKYSSTGVQSLREIELAAAIEKPILFVLLDDLDLTTLPTPVKFGARILYVVDQTNATEVANRIAQRLPTMTPQPAKPPGRPNITHLVEQLASDARASVEEPSVAEAPKAVFVVHGHDDVMMEQVSSFLRQEGVEPIVLKKLKGGQSTLFDKFRTVGGEALFAVVLISADDYGAGIDEYTEHNAGERALLYRARQNVILETGFFFGKLGWDNVFVLMKPPARKVPRFERPSDLDGVIFETFDDSADWKVFLLDQLRARKLI